MKIQVAPQWTEKEPRKPRHVSEYVQDAISQTYAHGELEQTREELTNTQRAFGKLVNVLAEKGILNAQDITNLIEDYSTAELIPE